MFSIIGKSDIGKSRDRSGGLKKIKQKPHKKEGEVMKIAQRNVLTIHETMPIINAAKLMEKNDFRRLPVVDAGTNRLQGLIVAIDILDFLGGGEKYNIILKDYNGNFLSAINCPVGKIMRNASFVDKEANITDVIDIMVKNRTSAIPIVNNTEDRKVIAIVTERDVLPKNEKVGIKVEEVMEKNVITLSLGMMISDVSKVMVRNGYRRLPVMQEDRLIGIVTVFDVLKFLEYGEFKGVDADEVLSERVEKIMESDVITVRKDQDIGEISALVKNTGIGGFPVLEKNKLIGIITTSDIIRGIYEHGKNFYF
ncbi:MAG: CBS domain-containing protein [Candidatus Altiarchaeota archaeon]